MLAVSEVERQDRTPFGGASLLADSVATVRPVAGFLRIETDPPDRDGWIGRPALAAFDDGPMRELLGRFEAAGFAANRRAAAASLLLRHGWAAGFAIAAYLAARRVHAVDDFALKFSRSTLLEGLWVKRSRVFGLEDDPLAGAEDWAGAESAEGLRRALLAALIAFTGPVVEDLHAWSRFSRHALWAMASSSWAEQFAMVGQRLGEPLRAETEARAVPGLDAQIARAAPELYEVRAGAHYKLCQKRAACCLWFKGPRREFCASCPIIPARERLERNLDWVLQHPPEGPGVAPERV